MATSNIPSEIIEIILSKLSSVKSLLRFKAVSKSWNTIISDPLFIQNHLQSSNSSPNNLFLSRNTNSTDRGFPLIKFEGPKTKPGEMFVENIPNGYSVILFECNGVLLLTSLSDRDRRNNRKYALWNPSTRWERHLETRYKDHVVDRGICYDKITGDFKVVFIYTTEYAIYSCKYNYWRKKKLGKKCYGAGDTGSGICIDGDTTYWILEESAKMQLVYFDSRIDEIKVLQKPEQLSEDDKYVSSYNMACLRGSLCLYCYNKDEKSVQMWIKEKGIHTWEKVITIGNIENLYLWSTQLCFVEVENKATNYSPTEKAVEKLVGIDIYRGRYVPYRNSLYFPTGVKTKTIKA
ncbi:hypothetical protein MIMGU_mgv1a025628mg [Erythranthe guttata]|uniref:F-box domain-containing protein n=1 Tax=Erythranthe guttata TaxID=4155 RepID=A0A022QW53_ERYGU|nr:PREDICTED: putative F-box/kelch-repeat protein At1g12870 [Erythranthe guttata]EYU31533.1 hypothetical protein MIMGU_mgv1a025628mg [Erythranthe guttata]|eukprot:XP_012844467.1 PREDICTED: putative F-box/kelch-repeat protein At1g12870 [Erythranthe guttata]